MLWSYCLDRVRLPGACRCVQNVPREWNAAFVGHGCTALMLSVTDSGMAVDTPEDLARAIA